MASIKDIRDSARAPQRAYEFEVAIVGAAAFGANAVRLLTQRVQNVSIPESSIETFEINFKSSKTIFAGRDASPHTVTVTFYDDESRETYSFFRTWMEAMRSPFDGSGVNRSEYGAAQMVISTFQHDSVVATGIDKLTTVFPTTLGEVTLSYDTSDIFTFDVTFSFDERIVE